MKKLSSEPVSDKHCFTESTSNSWVCQTCGKMPSDAAHHNVQDVDRCVRCNHERKCSDNLEGKCRYERVIEDIASSVCGCKCEFPSEAAPTFPLRAERDQHTSSFYMSDAMGKTLGKVYRASTVDAINELYARVQPPEQNSEDKNSGEMQTKASSLSSVVIPNYRTLDADRDYVPEGDPWPADVELANALDRYARESGLPLEAQLCPYCPNVGYYAEGPTDAPEQVQCEFCETVPNSLYRIKQAITQLAQSSEQPSTSDVLGNPDRGTSSRNEPESSSKSESTLVQVDEVSKEQDNAKS